MVKNHRNWIVDNRMEGKVSMQKIDKVKGFVKHGVRFVGTSSNNSYGDCPLCGKERKFYANPINLM